MCAKILARTADAQSLQTLKRSIRNPLACQRASLVPRLHVPGHGQQEWNPVGPCTGGFGCTPGNLGGLEGAGFPNPSVHPFSERCPGKRDVEEEQDSNLLFSETSRGEDPDRETLRTLSSMRLGTRAVRTTVHWTVIIHKVR